MFRSLRALLVLAQTLRLIAPLLIKGRRLRLPLLLREVALLALTNSDLIWKFLEKSRLSPEIIKRIMALKKRIKP